ncbi:MAG: SigB/SigF/SigG family RNA polymerase sigma factor [Clostridia bacterium]|nr:SigB/SigF/SigG family RNA polymerase sigma factor [Clostridia bacterium]MDE6758679.1 SigB/SigF/SigG family RNA polymerase sigma factor [Clostridia bacterium]MDE7079133.1 SigB/SigF/SigG family RNA polymerase sigma factor [Clostridia bacterium]
MLDYETTLKFLELAKNGDDQAKGELINANMPLIKSIARRYRNKQVEYDDLLQLGALGLVKAINNFDCSYNVKFSTYAVPMIAGEIKRFIRDDGSIKVSRAMKSLCSKIQTYVNEQYALNNTPSIKSIAQHFEIDEQEVVFAMDSNKYPISIFEKYEDDNNQCVMDKLASNENNDDVINKILLKDHINSLPEREKKVIILRYYRDKTQSEIAQLLGVSQVQISRIESKVINQLKQALA